LAKTTLAVIPVAGVGTRLRPHTFTLPKVLLNVAGKPILAHILDQLPGLGIRRVVLIVGHMGDLVRAYVGKHYPGLEVTYAEQPERLGLGHAVSLAEPYVDSQPVLVILGDTIFDVDLKGVLAGGMSRIGVHEVDDPQRFGIVETDAQGLVTHMVEKPEHPASKLAITGIYFFTDARPVMEALKELQSKNIRTRGEFQLTDAMQLWVERGGKLGTFPVAGWYDCGKTETLLETNRVLLDRRGGAPSIPGSVLHAPVVVGEGAVIENSIVGPHVSVAAGARLINAVVRDSIINEDARVEDILIEGSVVGSGSRVRGGFRRVNVGDSSEVSFP
jgi:glucose-1-phosphate thymidylyltransferase